jgi:hypothetical protein
MTSKHKRTGSSNSPDRRSLEALGNTASQVIQEAAAVLEEELAAGLIAARKVSERLKNEQRVEKADFEEALKRFRSTGHELIGIARSRLDDLRSDSTNELLQRFLTDAQGALDVVVDLASVGPELVNGIIKSVDSSSSSKK